MSVSPTLFRYDDLEHAYFYQGAQVPSITQMLLKTGWINDEWFTEESSERGQAVHKETAQYDLGAISIEHWLSLYRGYLLAHIECMNRLRPTFLGIEQPGVHPGYKFGGRPDRVLKVFRQLTIHEIKSGGIEKSHQIQTALQAILESQRYGLPPEAWQRQAEYLKPNGRYDLRPHKDARDFLEAREVIRKCCK